RPQGVSWRQFLKHFKVCFLRRCLLLRGRSTLAHKSAFSGFVCQPGAVSLSELFIFTATFSESHSKALPMYDFE
ncbi:MAG: hypothetical protein IKH41_06670, partial [Clostridia bacterium]|nr:hypothetical protein [Clostridia bacterium]